MPSAARAGALAPASVGLTVFVALAQLRLEDPWAEAPLLLLALVPAVAVLALGLAAGRGGPDRAASTVLLVAGLVLAAIAIGRLGQVVASDDYTDQGGGTLTWVLLLFTLVAALCHRRTGSTACLLVAALAAVGLVLEAVNWIFDTSDPDLFRALLTLSFVVLFAAGLAVSGRAGVILVGAAGVIVIASSYAFNLALLFSPDGPGLGWGWELVLLVQGLALAAYAARELEPGPGYLGFFALAIFVIIAAQTGSETFGGEQSQSLVGWPLAIGVATVLAGLWALRPGSAD